MGFDFDRSQRKQLGYQLIDRINDYFSGLSTRSVQQPAALRSFAPLGSDIPELGEDAATVLNLRLPIPQPF